MIPSLTYRVHAVRKRRRRPLIRVSPHVTEAAFDVEYDAIALMAMHPGALRLRDNHQVMEGLGIGPVKKALKEFQDITVERHDNPFR